MVVAAKLAKAAQPSIQQVAAIDDDKITVTAITQAIETVRPIYEELGANDKVAKGPELVKRLKASL
jgi:hypothetical protein